ncbi:type II toxin-antitoxin system VapC family toxin [Candidatus Woesearchaeota archaeon]|nr:type II toxin-antitoxin system VapC family toxin [Candidatus Woesearchaeota archaeon]
MAIFIDSSIFCAYANIDDVHNKKAVKIISEIVSNNHGKVITTDYVFDETVTVALRRTDKKKAAELGNFILNSEILIAKVDSIVFQHAWELFQKNHNFSFTDSTIIAFMQLFGINKIATFDKEFLKLKNIQVIDF